MSLMTAIEMATRAHSGMWRDEHPPLPYVTHVVEVVLNLRHVGQVTDLEMLCAAALHDTVETESLTLEEIRQKFGTTVGSLVAELTRAEPSALQIANMKKSEIWQMRADMLVGEISRMSEKAQVIKLADRLANLREARRTKKGKKLLRYLGQTRQILKVVPRSRNNQLWDAIQRELDKK